MSMVGGVRFAASVAVAGLFWLAPQPVALADGSGAEVSTEGSDDGVGGAVADADARRASERGVRAGGDRASGRAAVGGLTGATKSGAPGRVVRSGSAGVEKDLLRGVTTQIAEPAAAAPGVDGAARQVAVAAAPRRASAAGGAEFPVQVAESAAVVPAPVGQRVLGVADELGTAVPAMTARQVAEPTASVRAEASCGSCWAFGSAGAAPGPIVKAINQALTEIGFAIERKLDGIDRWLLSFPHNPVTDFLAGALWMVRRTLFPVGPGVGMGGTASCVTVKDCSGQDLTGVDLSGQYLVEINFSHAILADANLSDSILETVNMEGANLERANLAGAIFAEVNLAGANLERANLTVAHVVAVNLAGANLERANLAGAALDDVNLAGANLRWANLDGHSVSLPATNLRGVDMTNADLFFADLEGAYISDTVLVNANLTSVDAERTKFIGSNLLGANLRYMVQHIDTEWRRCTCPDGTVVRHSFGYCGGQEI